MYVSNAALTAKLDTPPYVISVTSVESFLSILREIVGSVLYLSPFVSLNFPLDQLFLISENKVPYFQ